MSRLWHHLGRSRAKAFAVLVIFTTTVSCDDLLVAPAPQFRAGLSLSVAQVDSPDTSASLQSVFERADGVRVRLLRDGAPVVDMSHTLAAEGGDTAVRVEVEIEGEREELELEIDVTWQDARLFEASQGVVLESGQTTQAEVTLEPVPAALAMPEGPFLLEAIGAQLQLSGAVLFATGDTIQGARLAWSTQNHDVISLSPEGRITAESEGQAQVTGTYGSLSETLRFVVDVAAVPVTIVGTFDSFTLVLSPADQVAEINRSIQYVATVLDQHGQEVPDAVLTWASSNPAIAQVDSAGLVHPRRVGTTRIAVSHQGFGISAQVTVVQP